jgi:cytoskeletal protein CcmA (bactofilin family)
MGQPAHFDEVVGVEVVILGSGVVVAGDGLDGGGVLLKLQQLLWATRDHDVGIYAREALCRDCCAWIQEKQRAIILAAGSCPGSDRRLMPLTEKSEGDSAASTGTSRSGTSRSGETSSSSAREGRATLQPVVERSFVIKGEVTSTESLYIEGRIEGMIHLADSRLTVGKTGEVIADIDAREIIVLGKVRGNCRASDRVDIRNGGCLMGNVITPRISIDEGASFKGGVEIRNPREVNPRAVAVGGSVPAASQEKRAEESSSQGRSLKREDGSDDDDALPKWKLEERKSAARKTVETH